MGQFKMHVASLINAPFVNTPRAVILWTVLLLAVTALLSAVTAQAKDLPGSSPTSWGVSQSGAFQFQIPVVIPAGRNGVQPNLSLGFSSGSGNGVLGVGWGLNGLGAITRCGRTIATDGVRGGVKHDADDRFCLNGQRLIKIAGSSVYGASGNEYRTEIDSVDKIVTGGNNITNLRGGTAPTYFEVWRKDGSWQRYGYVSDARVTLPNKTSVHSWKLSRSYDRAGNYYKVNYDSSTDHHQVSSIDYTLGNGNSGQQVTFTYEDRDDDRTGYIAGSSFTLDKRLKTIKVLQDTAIVRQYELAYTSSNVSGLSKLSSITEKGRNGEALPSIQITWAADTAGYTAATSAGDKAPDNLIEYYTFTRYFSGGSEANAVKQLNRGNFVDLNGDGRQDMLIAYTTPGGSTVKKVYLKNADGTWSTDQSAWHLPHPLRSYANSIVNTTTARFNSSVINMGQLADVNGDGLVDVVYSYTLNKHYAQDLNHQDADVETVKETYLNTGSGWGPAHDAASDPWFPKDILFDYLSNGAGNNRVETVRGRLMDLNGDRLADWVSAWYNYNSSTSYSVHKTTWLNTSNGWGSAHTGYQMPDVFVQYRGLYSMPHGAFVDVNGDGLPDWISSYWESGLSAVSDAWLNTGNSFIDAGSQYHLPDVLHDNQNGWNDAPPVTRGRFVDVNGDGLSDWVESYERVGGPGLPSIGKAIRLNTGNGWGALNSGHAAPPFINVNHRYSTFERGWPTQRQGDFIDIDRDGLVDYVESVISSASGFPVKQNAWRNTGTGWQVKTGSEWVTSTPRYDYSGRDKAKANSGLMTDINYDGAADWVISRAGVTNTTDLSTLPRADQLANITTTMGVVVQPSFEALTRDASLYQNGSGAAEADSLHVAGPTYVTSQLQTSNADSSGNGWNTTTYHYGGAQIHREGRGFLGFKTRFTIDLASGLTQYSEYQQNYPYIGRVKESRVFENATGGGFPVLPSSWISRRVNLWNTKTPNTDTTLPYVRIAYAYVRELTGQQFRRTKVTSTLDDYGNVTSRITDVGRSGSELERRTTVNNTYWNIDTANWFVGQLRRSTSTVEDLNDFDPTITRVTEYEYYPASDPNNPGALKQVEREPDSGDAAIYLKTNYSYDSAGNLTHESTTDLNSSETRTNIIGYDSDKRLPTSLENALQQEATIQYHPQCDQPATITEINNNATTFSYDNLCRQTQVTDAAQVSATTDYSKTAACPAGACQSSAAFYLETQNNDEPVVKTWFNRYGQLLVSETTGMLNEVIRQRSEVDHLGRNARQSQPYFSTDTVHWTETDHDVLGRVTLVTLPFDGPNGDATIQYDYGYDSVNHRQQRTTTNALDNTTTVYANALGQIEEIIDAAGNSLQYDYDARGNLLETIADATGALTNNIHVQYDLLGRRKQLNDPDMGTSNYTYDAFGQLSSQTDAKSQTINMGYDKLGRLTSRVVGGVTSEWHWDTDPDAGDGFDHGTVMGQIARIRIGDGSQDASYFSYDNLGRLDGKLTRIKGQAFSEALSYDATNGRLDSRYYPNSGVDAQGNDQVFAVKYNYTNGYLNQISGIDAQGNHCVTHWQADQYDALGRTRQDTLGTIVQTTRTFDGAQGVLKQIQSTLTGLAGTGTVQDLSYTYDANYNLKTRQDHALGSAQEVFQYDELDRLRFYNKGGPNKEVRYNALGNITYKSDVGDYQYSGINAGPHAVTKVTNGVTSPLSEFQVNWEWNGETNSRAQANIHNVDYVYDANGNITSQGNRRIYWTAFDKPSAMILEDGDGTQRGSNLHYDAEFDRTWKLEGEFNVMGQLTTPKQTTFYVGEDYQRIEEANGDIKHRYLINTGGGQIQIERVNDTDHDQPTYFLNDTLGSTNTVLNARGDVEQRLAFDPWGMREDTSWAAGAGTTPVNQITNRGYTGHEMDDEVGLINMNARIYDPYLGRFLSADPVLPDPYDMQSFNRYSYVRNNPMTYTDPTGNTRTRGGGSREVCGPNRDSDNGPTGGNNCGDFDNDPYTDCARDWLCRGWDIIDDYGPSADRSDLGELEAWEAYENGTGERPGGQPTIGDMGDGDDHSDDDGGGSDDILDHPDDRADFPPDIRDDYVIDHDAGVDVAARGKLFRLLINKLDEIEKSVKAARALKKINDIIRSASRPARPGSQDSRGVQALKKKLDRGDDAFSGTPKNQEAADKIIRETLGSKDAIVRETTKNGKQIRDVFDPSTGRGVRTVDGQFDTFLNLKPGAG